MNVRNYVETEIRCFFSNMQLCFLKLSHPKMIIKTYLLNYLPYIRSFSSRYNNKLIKYDKKIIYI